jgi:uncharacterized protein (DUF305 family)
MPFSSPRVVAAVLVLVAAILTSCHHGASDAAAGSSAAHDASRANSQAAIHDPADVAFARDMIPHHEQAVVLAAMVPDHTANPELRVMATHIGADQQAEIRTLNGLLAAWGENTVPHGGPPPDHGGMVMAGMVDQSVIDRLQSLHDDAFDTLWVTSMIGHHQGAITMARQEIAHGESGDAVRTATLIITAQQREIATMTHLVSASQ